MHCGSRSAKWHNRSSRPRPPLAPLRLKRLLIGCGTALLNPVPRCSDGTRRVPASGGPVGVSGTSAGTPAQNPMAQQNNEGTEYLLALKQLSQASAGSAPARTSDPVGQELNPDAGNSDEYQGTNKRRAPRYKCEGSVELREEGCDVRTWATFTDIGLHGCYVDGQATYPAGTILNMKLEASGIRVETRGNVRVNYPYLGMGI